MTTRVDGLDFDDRLIGRGDQKVVSVAFTNPAGQRRLGRVYAGKDIALGLDQARKCAAHMARSFGATTVQLYESAEGQVRRAPLTSDGAERLR